MADKADWCDTNVRHFIDICKGDIEAGNRPLGLFTRTAWKNLVTKYEEKTRLKQTKKQLKNKLDNMKIYMVYGAQEFCHWSWME